jgi:2-oxoglutarate ferredoxin oxidoreductase subunit alpha
MFALGLLSWLYHRPVEGTIKFLESKFAARPAILEANLAAFRAGWNYGETTEDFSVSYEVKPARLPAGRYRNISGNLALSYGLIAASRQSGLPLFLGAYPITPASDILHELSKHKRFGVRTFQAEDEIAGVGAALGAAFGGALGVTTTSGPGVALKAETIGLAVSLELPLVICDIQRGGPSTGLPTKTEQADLLMAMYGRNGEAPVPIVAPQSPSDCFDAAIEACRIALKYRTPVFLLSDGYLANGSEPWRVPDVETLPGPDRRVRDRAQPRGRVVLARTCATRRRSPGRGRAGHAGPGAPRGRHREAGRHGQHLLRPGQPRLMPDPAGQGRRHRPRHPAARGRRPVGCARVLVLGWGSTYGPIGAAVRHVRARGRQVAQAHLRHLNPFPANTGEVLRRYDTVLVPEMNLGQLAMLLRAKYLVDVVGYNKVRGLPFMAEEIAGVLEDGIPS